MWYVDRWKGVTEWRSYIQFIPAHDWCFGHRVGDREQTVALFLCHPSNRIVCVHINTRCTARDGNYKDLLASGFTDIRDFLRREIARDRRHVTESTLQRHNPLERSALINVDLDIGIHHLIRKRDIGKQRPHGV